MTDEALRRVDRLLTELVELVETARAVPMSASCVIPREHVLDLLDDLRDVLPPEMDEARRIAAQRDEVLGEATQLADRLRLEAERSALDARAEFDGQAESIVGQARQHAVEMRASAEQYVLEVRASAEKQAQELLAAARAQHDQLLTADGVHQAAIDQSQALRHQADEYVATTRARAEEYAAGLHANADGYAEQTLTDLVAVLSRALATTEQGRQELARRRS